MTPTSTWHVSRWIGAWLLLAVSLAPGAAGAQCVGASAQEDFAVNMKGCAAAIAFTARASKCAAGWHVCTSQEWTSRHAGKFPHYNYWVNDSLPFYNTATPLGCSASASFGNSCPVNNPMHVCTIGRGDLDGAFTSGARLYLVQTFLPAGGISLVTALDTATLHAQTYIGTFISGTFAGDPLGGPSGVTLSFTTSDLGTDGTSPIVRLASPPNADANDFYTVLDPLGNSCAIHSCGLESFTPNHYFGGCLTGELAGTLCCQ